MRRSFAWLLGGFFFGFLRRRQHEEQAQPELPDARAEELRRKLAEAREVVEERDEFEAAEPTVDQTEHAPEDPSLRRRAVHDSAREIAARMRESERS